MAVDARFMLTGAKRVFDSRPMYAQVVVTDDCNLSCEYCDEYTPGAPGVPLMHPDLPDLLAHTKAKRRGSNVVTVISNGFFLTKRSIERLNDSGFDYLQVSVDSIEPTPGSNKSLKSVMPRLRLLAQEAKFQVEIQTVLNEDTLPQYDRFRELTKEFPFK